MDPNETLAQLRAAIVTFRNAAEGDTEDELAAAWQVAELAEALDGWLTRGGAWPRSWEMESRS